MAKKRDNIEGVPLTGRCDMTITVRLVSHQDCTSHLPPEAVRIQITSSIVDPGMGRSRQPEGVWSPGFQLGMELARVSKPLRRHLADWDDVADGFSYELNEGD